MEFPSGGVWPSMMKMGLGSAYDVGVLTTAHEHCLGTFEASHVSFFRDYKKAPLLVTLQLLIFHKHSANSHFSSSSSTFCSHRTLRWVKDFRCSCGTFCAPLISEKKQPWINTTVSYASAHCNPGQNPQKGNECQFRRKYWYMFKMHPHVKTNCWIWHEFEPVCPSYNQANFRLSLQPLNLFCRVFVMIRIFLGWGWPFVWLVWLNARYATQVCTHVYIIFQAIDWQFVTVCVNLQATQAHPKLGLGLGQKVHQHAPTLQMLRNNRISKINRYLYSTLSRLLLKLITLSSFYYCVTNEDLWRGYSIPLGCPIFIWVHTFCVGNIDFFCPGFWHMCVACFVKTSHFVFHWPGRLSHVVDHQKHAYSPNHDKNTKRTDVPGRFMSHKILNTNRWNTDFDFVQHRIITSPLKPQ